MMEAIPNCCKKWKQWSETDAEASLPGRYDQDQRNPEETAQQIVAEHKLEKFFHISIGKIIDRFTDI